MLNIFIDIFVKDLEVRGDEECKIAVLYANKMVGVGLCEL
jgi:hypothetical protein